MKSMRISKLSIGGVEHEISNTVLIIGGNNAGKTKFLQSIHDDFTGLVEYDGVEHSRSQTRENHWASMVNAGYFSYTDSELKEWSDAQEKWKVKSDGPQTSVLYRSSKHILQWQGHEGTAIYESSYNDLRTNTRHNPPTTELQWIIPFKKSHTQELSVEQRFNESNGLTSLNIADENSPYVLYTNQKVLNSITAHLLKLFKRKLYLIMTSATNYSILAVEPTNTSLPVWPKSSRPDRLFKAASAHKLYYDQHREDYIGEQSHGTRAAMSLLMALTDKTRKILFIDEPELHLYPMARRYLANIIAGESKMRQVFMVTHDPLIIDGIALSRKDFTVIKINRNREVKLVNFDQQERRRTSSELKNSQAIQAGFLDSALFVEGISDKYTYGSIINRKKMIDASVEFGIVDCGGNDKIADHVKFAYDIGTKVAVVTDFDTLYDVKERDGEKVPIIVPILQSLRLPDDLISQAKILRPKLVQSRMKTSGLSTPGISADVLSDSTEFINKLRAHGIFIVPCGELYDWFGKRDSKKTISPEWLRNKYFNGAKNYPELTKFLEDISSYLNSV